MNAISIINAANEDLIRLKAEISGKTFNEVKNRFAPTYEEDNAFYCGYHHIGVYIANDNGKSQISAQKGMEIWDDEGNMVGLLRDN